MAGRLTTPSLLRGFFYSTTKMRRCRAYHPCVATFKCQNFDRHNLHCQICESRVWPRLPRTGGYIPSGEYLADLQETIKQVQRYTRSSMMDMERKQPGTRIVGQSSDPNDNLRVATDRMREAQELLKDFEGLDGTSFTKEFDPMRDHNTGWYTP